MVDAGHVVREPDTGTGAACWSAGRRPHRACVDDTFEELRARRGRLDGLRHEELETLDRF